MVHHVIRRNLPVGHVVPHFISLHTLTPYLCKINPYITFPSTPRSLKSFRVLRNSEKTATGIFSFLVHDVGFRLYTTHLIIVPQLLENDDCLLG
jgi:hypothetical protein